MRRSAIIGTTIIISGFFVGFINNWFFTNNQWFLTSQYGLTRSVNDFAQILYGLSFLAIPSLFVKFFPYYNSHLSRKDNDLLGLGILSSTIAFGLVLIAGIYFKDFFVRKFSNKSAELVHIYYWIYVYAFFLLQYQILEAYMWCLGKSLITIVLKECIFRIYQLILILLFVGGYIGFSVFIKAFVFSYCVLVLFLVFYLISKNHVILTSRISKVTWKFWKKMTVYALYIYLGAFLTIAASQNDSIAISGLLGQSAMGIFALMTYLSTIILVPQRSTIAVATAAIATAWREKNFKEINRIYVRSSINLLFASLLLFGLIVLSFEDIILFLKMNPIFLTGKLLFCLFGLKAVIDMGTGLNSQIIALSNFWKFEFITGIVLMLIIAPLTYFLVKSEGLIGVGISTLISYTIYNLIRLAFLYIKLKMQPFSINSVLLIIFSLIAFFITYACFKSFTGLYSIVIRSLLFVLLFCFPVWKLKLTPDLEPVLKTVRTRLVGAIHWLKR